MTKEEKSRTKKISKKKIRQIFLAVIAIIILGGLFLFGSSIVYAKKVLPGVSVGGTDISGLSQEAAKQQIEKKISQLGSLNFRSGENSWKIKIEDVGVKYETEKSLDQAYNIGKNGSVFQRLTDQIKTFFVKTDLPLIYNLDEEKYFLIVDQLIGAKLENKELETQVIVQNSQARIIPGKKGRRIKENKLLTETKSVLDFPQDKEIKVVLGNAEPRVSSKNAQNSLGEAQKIIASELNLLAKDKNFTADSNLIGSWITGKVVEDSTLSAKDKRVYSLTADLDSAKIKAYIQALAKEVNKEPANAKVAMENGQLKVLADSALGQTLKEDENTQLIIDNLLSRKSGRAEAQINLVIEDREPDISSENVASLGINELIGKAATDFTSSPENRKHNIRVGANSLSGIIVKDGEEFSSLKALGKIDEASGYKPELVINNNKLEADFGGGLCQNATTLFRAVLDAGLPITQRQNHSRRVSYYEKATNTLGVNLTFNASYASIGNSLVGYDATVFIPQPDLKFKNNTGYAILVQEYTSGNVVIAEIYGSKDDRKPLITKAEVLSTKPVPETIYHDAPNLPKGTNNTISKGAAGAKTKFIYTITYADGKQESQEFISYYRAIAPEVQVGSQELVQTAPTSAQ